MHDLEPPTGTPLNDKLRLDRATARAMSPLHRVRGGMPPALLAAGGMETAAFRQQTADIVAGSSAAVTDVFFAPIHHPSVTKATAPPVQRG